MVFEPYILRNFTNFGPFHIFLCVYVRALYRPPGTWNHACLESLSTCLDLAVSTILKQAGVHGIKTLFLWLDRIELRFVLVEYIIDHTCIVCIRRA